MWAYVPVALVFGITPGPDVILAVRASLSRGPRGGVLVALGAASGSLVWGLAVAVGLASLLTRFPAALTVLRIGGAAYLAWLGIQSLRQARAAVSLADRTTPAPTGNQAGRGAFRTGLVADLLNPKMGAFYLAIIPQFIPAGGDVFAWAMLLMAIEFIIAIACLTGYALLASTCRRHLERGSVTVWLQRVLGVVLIGFGIRVALG